MQTPKNQSPLNLINSRVLQAKELVDSGFNWGLKHPDPPSILADDRFVPTNERDALLHEILDSHPTMRLERDGDGSWYILQDNENGYFIRYDLPLIITTDDCYLYLKHIFDKYRVFVLTSPTLGDAIFQIDKNLMCQLIPGYLAPPSSELEDTYTCSLDDFVFDTFY